MKTNCRLAIGLSLAVLAAGCGGPDDAGHDHDAAHGAGEIELFEKNRGVRLPEELRRDLGVATVEVVERPVTRHFEKMAHVYRTGNGESPAAAVVWLEESEAGQVRAGQGVTWRRQTRTAPAEEEPRGDAARVGKVVRIEAPTGPAARRREALIELPDPDGQLPVGSALNVRFSPGQSHLALAVPESAVIRGAGGPFVYAANGGHLTRIPVKTGAQAEGWVEIIDGLYAGDVVVARAVDSLWLIELCALKGGSPCCPVPTKKRHE